MSTLSSACPQTASLSLHGAPPAMSHDFIGTTSSTPLTTSSGSPSRKPRPIPSTASTPRSSSTSQSYDEPDDDRQRWSTWFDVDPLCRGPEPRPDWVVTSHGAIDTELGILKTGKEADVFLLERADPHGPDGAW